MHSVAYNFANFIISSSLIDLATNCRYFENILNSNTVLASHRNTFFYQNCEYKGNRIVMGHFISDFKNILIFDKIVIHIDEKDIQN
jgi:hypothetical protein